MSRPAIEMSSTPEMSKPRFLGLRSGLLLISVLTLSSVVIVRGIRHGEFSYNVDETQHAVTGLYVADVLRDLPLTHLVQYTYHYYAQYPALSGVIHWPPFYYLWEGLFFFFLGPSVVAARLSIVLFALVGLTFFFLLVREFSGDWTAALATAFLAMTPSVLLLEKTVMLEIPSLALSLAALFFWTWYLLQDRHGGIYPASVMASLALLTKQNAIFVILFFLATALWIHGWRWFRQREVVRAGAIGLLMTAPFYGLVYFVHWGTIAMDLEDAKISGLRGLLFYWKALPSQIGWVILLLSILGILTFRIWDRSRFAGMMLIWIASCYVTFTAIGLKESRYIIYWVPAFVYFAAGLITRFFRAQRLQVPAAIAGVLILGMTVCAAWRFQRPLISGYAAAAQGIVEMNRAGVVLYDADLAGDFIFFMRAYDPERQFVVLRKALYAYRIKKTGGAVDLVHGREALENLIRENGVRFVVVSKELDAQFASQQLLRELVAGPGFRPVGSFPIVGDDPASRNSALLAFENLNWAPPTSKFLKIQMLTLRHPIVVPFDEYKFAQGAAVVSPAK